MSSRRTPSPVTVLTALPAPVLGLGLTATPRAEEAAEYRVRVFSKVTNVAHDSIPAGVAAIGKRPSRRGRYGGSTRRLRAASPREVSARRLRAPSQRTAGAVARRASATSCL